MGWNPRTAPGLLFLVVLIPANDCSSECLVCLGQLLRTPQRSNPRSRESPLERPKSGISSRPEKREMKQVTKNWMRQQSRPRPLVPRTAGECREQRKQFSAQQLSFLLHRSKRSHPLLTQPAANSFALCVARITALINVTRSPPSSSSRIPSMVHPAGVVTSSLSSAG